MICLLSFYGIVTLVDFLILKSFLCINTKYIILNTFYKTFLNEPEHIVLHS